MITVLIVITYVSGCCGPNFSGTTVTFQEFASAENCKFAQAIVEGIRQARPQIETMCVPK